MVKTVLPDPDGPTTIMLEGVLNENASHRSMVKSHMDEKKEEFVSYTFFSNFITINVLHRNERYKCLARNHIDILDPNSALCVSIFLTFVPLYDHLYVIVRTETT